MVFKLIHLVIGVENPAIELKVLRSISERGKEDGDKGEVGRRKGEGGIEEGEKRGRKKRWGNRREREKEERGEIKGKNK